MGFYGINQTSKKWELTETYGGKLTENSRPKNADHEISCTVQDTAFRLPPDAILIILSYCIDSQSFL